MKNFDSFWYVAFESGILLKKDSACYRSTYSLHWWSIASDILRNYLQCIECSIVPLFVLPMTSWLASMVTWKTTTTKLYNKMSNWLIDGLLKKKFIKEFNSIYSDLSKGDDSSIKWVSDWLTDYGLRKFIEESTPNSLEISGLDLVKDISG